MKLKRFEEKWNGKYPIIAKSGAFHLFPVSAGVSEDHLYDQYHRGLSLVTTQGDENHIGFPLGRIANENAVFGGKRCEPEMDNVRSQFGTHSFSACRLFRR